MFLKKISNWPWNQVRCPFFHSFTKSNHENLPQGCVIVWIKFHQAIAEMKHQTIKPEKGELFLSFYYKKAKIQIHNIYIYKQKEVADNTIIYFCALFQGLTHSSFQVQQVPSITSWQTTQKVSGIRITVHFKPLFEEAMTVNW